MKAEAIIEERDSLSLYDRIRQEIESNIMSGRWPPGHRIPFKHELIKQYQCSRMTINRALGALVERGLIERRQRVGSFVLAPKYHRAAFELPDLRSHISSQGKKYDFDVLEREIRQATASDRSNLDIAGGEVLYLKCVHYVDGKPFAVENRIINLELAPDAREASFDQEPPNSWLFGHVPWSDARHRISLSTRMLISHESLASATIARASWSSAGRGACPKRLPTSR